MPYIYIQFYFIFIGFYWAKSAKIAPSRPKALKFAIYNVLLPRSHNTTHLLFYFISHNTTPHAPFLYSILFHFHFSFVICPVKCHLPFAIFLSSQLPFAICHLPFVMSFIHIYIYFIFYSSHSHSLFYTHFYTFFIIHHTTYHSIQHSHS